MKFITRILSVLVFLVTALNVYVLVTFVLTSDFHIDVPVIEPSPLTENDYDEAEGESIFSRALSKLTMMPSLSFKKGIVAVVIENHEDARRFHEGLSEALMVQEYLVEGLISRFVALYDVRRLPSSMGPVRSLRPYFLDGIQPFASTVFHAGGSPEALERVYAESITNVNGLALDEGWFVRHKDAAAPHNLFLERENLLKLLPSDPTPITWPPYDTGGILSGDDATTVRIDFHNVVHDVLFEYNWKTGTYTRINGGVESAAHPRNVIVLEVPILSEGEYGRLNIDFSGKGRMFLFKDGRVAEGTWRKNSVNQPLEFLDENGDSFRLRSGQTWMTVMHTLDRVSWIHDREE